MKNGIVIFFTWVFLNLSLVTISGMVTASINDMSLIMAIGVAIIAISFSVIHPGGWLSIAGLITAFVKRDRRWLALSTIGAIMTGVTVPFLEGIGANMI